MSVVKPARTKSRGKASKVRTNAVCSPRRKASQWCANLGSAHASLPRPVPCIGANEKDKRSSQSSSPLEPHILLSRPHHSVPPAMMVSFRGSGYRESDSLCEQCIEHSAPAEMSPLLSQSGRGPDLTLAPAPRGCRCKRWNAPKLEQRTVAPARMVPLIFQ
jgi:hypothetical protein